MDQYFVVTPLNTNYRAGDSGGDMTIVEAPTAAYYTDKEAAVTAAKQYNKEKGFTDQDTLSEQGALVMLVVWDPVL